MKSCVTMNRGGMREGGAVERVVVTLEAGNAIIQVLATVSCFVHEVKQYFRRF